MPPGLIAQGAEQLAGLGSVRGRQKVGGGEHGQHRSRGPWAGRLVDQDIAGLKVAMNDALFVAAPHCVADSGQQFEGRPARPSACCERTRPEAFRG